MGSEGIVTAAGGVARKDHRRGLWWLLACMAAWSSWFIYRSSFVFAGRRVFCLFEDAMISMTYARNLVEGHGLNWARAGEPVEGFTHPLWVALMVPANLLSFDLRYRSLIVQLLSLAILVWHVVLVRRLALRFFSTGPVPSWLPAALLTAFYYPLTYWSLMGMESGLQALLTTASVLLALDIVCHGEDRHRELFLLGAAAYLLRMDMVVMVSVVQLYVLANGGLRQARQRSHWWQGAAVFAAVAAGYSVFRWLYFREVLPNTYYLKLFQIPLDIRLLRGGRALWESFADHLLLLAVVGAGAGVLMRYSPDRELRRRLLLPSVLFAAISAYSVYVGGDAWEMPLNMRANRFVVYAMPQVFLLFNALVSESAGRLGTLGRRRFVAIATVFGLMTADGLWLAARSGENWLDLAVARPPLLADSYASLYGELRSLQGILGPTAVVATACAGIPAYFSDYQMADLLGYNDRHVARLPPALPLALEDYQRFTPGHMKWDYAYLLAHDHPDAIMRPVAVGRGDTRRLLTAAGYRYDAGGSYWLPSGLSGSPTRPGSRARAGGP
jgi:hypothetical protein